MSLSGRITEYIQEQYLGGDTSAELTAETPLLELNILDSASIFDIIRYLSESEDVEVPIEDVTPDNFSTIANMVALIEKYNSREN
jgi:peptidyl carrier protein